MPRPSSLPAQAARTAGSKTIAAIFADVPKPKLFHLPVSRILLDRPAAKWNSQLGYHARFDDRTWSLARQDSTNPRPLGKQWRVGWVCTRGRCGGNVDLTAPAGLRFSRAWRARCAA